MVRKSYATEKIIGLLRQAEAMLSQGKTPERLSMRSGSRVKPTSGSRHDRAL